MNRKRGKGRLIRLISDLIPYFRTKRILIGCAAVVLLLIVSVAAAFIPVEKGDFIPYKRNVEVISYQNGLSVLVDGALLSRLDGAEHCQQLRTSMDGSVAAFLTEDRELYLADSHRLKKIANDVHHFEISVSGNGIAYAQQYVDQYALTLYNVHDRSSREITDSLSRLDFSLSPDGKTVAYYEKRDDQEVLMCHRKEKNLTISDEDSDLIGLSNDGKCIYVVCSNATDQSVLCAYNARGMQRELGHISSISFKFSANHRQIMYYNDGKTYISSNGQKGKTVSSYPLYLVTAPNSQSTADGNAITYPVSSLFNHVYTCSDGESTSAWLIKKDAEKSIPLVSRVSGCTLDASADYLYYLHDMKQLRYIQISDGQNAAEGYRSLADNVDAYALTSNRKFAYFTSNGALCIVNSKRGGSVRTICQDITNLTPVLNKGDFAYYLKDGQLYVCKNGRRITSVAKNIQSIYSSSNSVVYILGDDGLYTSTDRKQPVPVSH